MQNPFQIIFWVALAFSAYTIAGYPLLLYLLSRFRGNPVRKDFRPKTVTVLLPVRNGGRWIRAKLESLLALNYPPELMQIVVISDGSTDATEQIAREFASTRRVQLICLPAGGKAAALNAGLEMARGEILFFTDARQRLEPDSLRNLVACFADPRIGAASGELIIRDGETLEERSVGLYWRYEKWMRKRESRMDSVMGATGCIYAMRRELAVRLPPGTLADDMFLPLAAFCRGYRVILDDSARAFDYPTALDSEFRRKVRTQAGVFQIIRAYPRLLLPSHRMWLSFVSHKLGRLLLPYAVLLAAITAFSLDEPWRAAVLAGELALALLVLADWRVARGFALKRVSAPLRSFVVLLAASLCAGWIFLRPPAEVWKETRVQSPQAAP